MYDQFTKNVDGQLIRFTLVDWEHDNPIVFTQQQALEILDYLAKEIRQKGYQLLQQTFVYHSGSEFVTFRVSFMIVENDSSVTYALMYRRNDSSGLDWIVEPEPD
ncbi:hypothetical protein GCM10028805_49140 [Spirosoma harenae]